MSIIKNLNHLEGTAYEVIEYSAKNKTVILMTIDGFQTDEDALFLRDMLVYAKIRGVKITFVPKTNESN